MTTSLCIDCGLCCDGTMYSTVEIDDTDGAPELEGKGLEFVVQDAKRVFEQECTAFRSGC